MRPVLAALSDKFFLAQAKQLFSSVYFNSGWKGDYLLLAHDLPKKKTRWFEKKGIIVKNVKPLDNRTFPRHPPVILSKFHFFSDMFKDWDQIVFLDSDMIVLASLDHLLKAKGFSAVADIDLQDVRAQFLPEKERRSKEQVKKWKEMERKFDLGSKAFNLGLFTLRPKSLKKDSFQQIWSLYEQYGDLANFEQSILNLYYNNKWNELPMVFGNYYPYHRPSPLGKPKDTDAIVHHFVFDKPWEGKNRPYDRLWEKNLKRAEKIDLSDRLPAIREWTEDEIRSGDRFIRKLNGPRPALERAAYTIDRGLGKVGSLIRK